jgi:pimeloyl-ACP methyl ester carboxylesterase
LSARETTATVDVDGRRLAYRSVGDGGEPLLLINGYAGSKADWDPTFLASLALTFTVICPDNRGIGGSDLGDPGELTVEAMAADLIGLLDQLQIPRLPIVGWSMGGFVAQALTLRYPERVSALVLLATDAGGPRTAFTEPEIWSALTDHSGTAREQASRVIGVLFPSPLAEQIDRDFGDVVAVSRSELRGETLVAQEAAIDAWHATELPRPAEATAPPVLAMAGSEDLVIPPENLRALAGRWPGCRTELFDGGGHAFMAQEPERLAALIASFASR